MPAALTLSSAAISSSQVVGLGAAELVEQRLVDPDPVGRVDVDRRRDPVAVILGELLQRRRDHLVPAFLGRRSASRSPSDALLGPVEDVEAEHLHRGRRVAGGDARAQHGHRLRRRRRRRPACPSRRCPRFSRSFFSTLSAAASPPEVHQCSTSTSAAAARLAEVASAASAVRVVPIHRTHRVSSSVAYSVRPPTVGQVVITQGARVRPIRICTVFTSRNSSSP